MIYINFRNMINNDVFDNKTITNKLADSYIINFKI